MRKELPIAECMFGWGQVFRLYNDMLDVQGKCYALKDLTHIRPIYQHIMGVDSVRLELHFGKKQVTLRGIAAIGEAQKAIDYLTSQYLGIAQANANATGTTTFHNWERERKPQFKTIPRSVLPLVQQSSPNALNASEGDVAEEPEHAIVDGFLDSTPGTETGDLGLPLEDIETLDDDCLQEFAQAPTAKVETPTPNWQHFRKEQHERRQRRLDVARSLREHGFDVDRLVRKLKEEPLPFIHVPVYLQDGEIAHYSVDATLCGEPIGESIRYTYPAKDHGTLILTNTRMIYMGRKSQIVLDYGRLLHVSRLRGAIAFQATHWYRREIFELRRPLECVMYIGAILTCFQHSVETRQSESFNEACTENIAVAEINGIDGISTVNLGSIPRSLLDWSNVGEPERPTIVETALEQW